MNGKNEVNAFLVVKATRESRGLEGGRCEAYTYMVRCNDGSLYTGWTYNLEKRVAAHNSGKGAKYTKSRLPVELVYYETFFTKEAAMSREFAIKRLTRREKLKLLNKD